MIYVFINNTKLNAYITKNNKYNNNYEYNYYLKIIFFSHHIQKYQLIYCQTQLNVL